MSQGLTLLATGLDSRELATKLFLSEHTINDHVKAVLAKSGTRTRRRLLTRVLGVGRDR
ncbi:LuxR C-terminal-related transcriptional regulator [Nocardia fluminea]|uniref:LuxR C-terminal-related transcriptional regulator n=1 Tax=Nocardia fluminea TaxID=134984 RepID=UPI0033C82020